MIITVQQLSHFAPLKSMVKETGTPGKEKWNVLPIELSEERWEGQGEAQVPGDSIGIC